MSKTFLSAAIMLSLLGASLQAVTPPAAPAPSVDHDIPAIEDELVLVELLIKASQNNVTKLEKLKGAIEAFRKAQTNCMQKPNNTELLYDMAKKGKVALDIIDDMKLQDYFRPDFITELEKMAQVANKQPIPPAR